MVSDRMDQMLECKGRGGVGILSRHRQNNLQGGGPILASKVASKGLPGVFLSVNWKISRRSSTIGLTLEIILSMYPCREATLSSQAIL